MSKFEPNYKLYTALHSHTIPEFSLIINKINPKLYTKRELNVLFTGNQPFVPEELRFRAISAEFRANLESAQNTFTLLTRYPWKRQDYRNLIDGTIKLDLLVKIAREYEITIAEEFLTCYQQRAIPSDLFNPDLVKPVDNTMVLSQNHPQEPKANPAVNILQPADENKMPDTKTNHITSNLSYERTDINVAVIEHILPELLPNKKQVLSKEELFSLHWQCFTKLQDALTKVGATKISTVPNQNKKKCSIKYQDSFQRSYLQSFDSLRKTIKELCNLYINQP